jgi:orotidine-5'-phosphate decarboxylase
MRKYGPLVFGLDPFGDLLEAWGLGDTPDGLDAFADIVVEAAAGTVGVVKPQSAFYERHGWRGIRTLSRLIHSCRSSGVLVLLDAKRGDVGSTNTAYAEAYLGMNAGIPVDAMTITPYLGFDALRPFLDLAHASDTGIFVVTRSTNPEGRSIQAATSSSGMTVEQELVTQISAENRRVAPGRIGPVGSVFGPTHAAPEGFDLRDMNGLFLAPGVGAQGAKPMDVATCFASCPDRVLPSASRSLLSEGPDPSRMKAAAEDLGTELLDALGLTLG